jgi:rhamnosyltransferase subunit B
MLRMAREGVLAMNALLVALGSAGDVYPFIGLGLRLRARGHSVTLLANGHFEPAARRVGIDFEELGPAAEYRSLVERPELWKPISALRLAAEWLVVRPMRRTFEIIRERNNIGETVVVAPVTAFGARIAQERLAVPLVSICLHPTTLRSHTCPPILKPLPVSRNLPRIWNKFWYWLSDRTLMDPLVRRETNSFRAELGLPPVRQGFVAWSFSPLGGVGLFPEWFAAPQPGWPSQFCLSAFPLCDDGDFLPDVPEAADHFEAGERPIIFTPGSAMRRGQAFFEAAVDACRRLDTRGVLVSRYADQIPRGLPPSIRAFDSLPFGRAFPRAAVVVHHGGIGNASLALKAGVPQLIMPMAFDQHDNAARLERLGVARSLSPRSFRGPAVARMIRKLIDSPAVASSCRRAADRFSVDDQLTEPCHLIEQAVKHPF